LLGGYSFCNGPALLFFQEELLFQMFPGGVSPTVPITVRRCQKAGYDTALLFFIGKGPNEPLSFSFCFAVALSF